MMTAGLVMAITKKKILPGALVMVSCPIEKEQTKNPTRQFEGQEFTVKTKHIANGPMAKPQYTLYGCEGPNHKPYWFLEDELIVISEVKSCH